ncbi:flavin-containing monooxygenase [Sporobolomyces koalae]|uniref:flavin-containing monooxygenase n=1 Tax=Sporobolomyces koalae TaxID=500713 RepID=UPI00317E3ED8
MSGSDSDATVVHDSHQHTPRSTSSSASALTALWHWPIALTLSLLRQAYLVYQTLLGYIFSGTYLPLQEGQKALGRVAIVGAGLTGVSSAAHLVDHGFDVVIFEAESDVGGVWARENRTSQLQLNSFLYRFHPSIKWTKGFPQRDEIIAQIRGVWEKYDLEAKTRFSTRVNKVIRHESSTNPRQHGHARWIINDGKEGVFDAIICAVGTCGEPKLIDLEGQDSFRGTILHSSQLDSAELVGQKVVIVGSGASGVEAAELAVQKKANGVVVLARSDKWVIPRNTVIDILLSLQPFGREMPLSFIPEWLIRKLHYRDLEGLSPAKNAKGLFEGTPIVNDEYLEHIREGLVTYKRCDTQKIVARGIKIVERPRGTKSGDEGQETVESADVIIIATGYKRPALDFLPKDLFPTDDDRCYERPSLYLQNFSVSDWSVLCTNASYMDGLGTVGNWHIGIYARIQMVFLLDPSTRPIPASMKTWVDVINFVKKTAWGDSGPGLAFFSYAELCLWIVAFHLFNPRRLPWLPFVLFGVGVRPQKGEMASRVSGKLASVS